MPLAGSLRRFQFWRLIGEQVTFYAGVEYTASNP